MPDKQTTLVPVVLRCCTKASQNRCASNSRPPLIRTRGNITITQCPPVKEGLYRIQILCRRHPFWSYPAGLTTAEVSPSVCTPLPPSLFTPHQILYSPSLFNNSDTHDGRVESYKLFITCLVQFQSILITVYLGSHIVKPC